MALECEDDDVVKGSLSDSSNDSDLVLKWNTVAFILKYFGLNQTKREIRDQKSSKMLPWSTRNHCETWKDFKFI